MNSTHANQSNHTSITLDSDRITNTSLLVLSRNSSREIINTLRLLRKCKQIRVSTYTYITTLILVLSPQNSGIKCFKDVGCSNGNSHFGFTLNKKHTHCIDKCQENTFLSRA
uniref:Uncharacterized protein n=1 Tax=Cacopsylla melanoneura TaxID=428564 RepID=A0A8D8ZVU1_9HEMI